MKTRQFLAKTLIVSLLFSLIPNPIAYAGYTEIDAESITSIVSDNLMESSVSSQEIIPQTSEQVTSQTSDQITTTISESSFSFVPNPIQELPVPAYIEEKSNSIFSLYPDKAAPSSYDSRTFGYITSVKNQNPYGTCWTFATIATLEANAVKKGLAPNTIDLSERHVAYFSYHTAKDPLGNTEFDTIISSPPESTSYLTGGGNIIIASMALMNGKGAASESDFPYNKDSAAGMVITPESEAFHQEIRLKGAYGVPGNSDRELKKQLIMDYGAITTSVYWPNDDSAYYNSTEYTFNNPDNTNTNHAVTIIGWDDTFPKEKFKKVPTIDGAWIVKNSWGTSWGNAGYFYLSYQDATQNAANVTNYALEAELSNVNDYDYTYSGVVPPIYNTNNVSLLYGQRVATAHEMKASSSGREKINGVKIGLLDTNVGYSLQLYRFNLTEGQIVTNPTSGVALLSAPVTGTTTYSGIYTIPLSEAIYVNQGETICAVVTFSESESSNYVTVYGSQDGNVFNITAGNESSNLGEAFYYAGGKWYDTYEDSLDPDPYFHYKGITPKLTLLTSNASLSEVDNFAGTYNQTTGITLTWNQNTDATSYKIERKIAGQDDSSYNLIATIGESTTTSHVDADIETGTKYYYRILAFNDKLESSWSSPMSVITPITPPTLMSAVQVGNQEASITFLKSVEHYDGFVFWQQEVGTADKIQNGSTTNLSQNSYTFTGLQPGKTYRLGVSALVDYEGDVISYDSNPSDEIVMIPDAPVISSNDLDASSEYARVLIGEVEGVSNYQVQRRLYKDTVFTSLSTTTDQFKTENGQLYFYDYGISKGQEYEYRICSDADGIASAWSNTIIDRVLLKSPIIKSVTSKNTTSLSVVIENIPTAKYFEIDYQASGFASKTVSQNAVSGQDVELTLPVITGEKYTINVYAYREYSDGTILLASETVLPDTYYAIPQRPVILSVSQNAQGVTLAFESNENTDGYEVFRSLEYSQVGEKIADLGGISSHQQSHLDENVSAPNTYYYTIRSYVINGLGEKITGEYSLKKSISYSGLYREMVVKPTPSEIEYGQKLSASILSNGKYVVGGESIQGTYSYVNPYVVPTPGNQYEYMFTPDDKSLPVYMDTVLVPVQKSLPVIETKILRDERFLDKVFLMVYATVSNPYKTTMGDNLPDLTLTYTVSGVEHTITLKQVEGSREYCFSIPEEMASDISMTISSTENEYYQSATLDLGLALYETFKYLEKPESLMLSDDEIVLTKGNTRELSIQILPKGFAHESVRYTVTKKDSDTGQELVISNVLEQPTQTTAGKDETLVAYGSDGKEIIRIINGKIYSTGLSNDKEVTVWVSFAGLKVPCKVRVYVPVIGLELLDKDGNSVSKKITEQDTSIFESVLLPTLIKTSYFPLNADLESIEFHSVPDNFLAIKTLSDNQCSYYPLYAGMGTLIASTQNKITQSTSVKVGMNQERTVSLSSSAITLYLGSSTPDLYPSETTISANVFPDIGNMDMVEVTSLKPEVASVSMNSLNQIMVTANMVGNTVIVCKIKDSDEYATSLISVKKGDQYTAPEVAEVPKIDSRYRFSSVVSQYKLEQFRFDPNAKNQIQIQNQYRDIQEPTLFQFKSSNEKIVMVDQYGNFWANPVYSSASNTVVYITASLKKDIDRRVVTIPVTVYSKKQVKNLKYTVVNNNVIVSGNHIYVAYPYIDELNSNRLIVDIEGYDQDMNEMTALYGYYLSDSNMGEVIVSKDTKRVYLRNLKPGIVTLNCRAKDGFKKTLPITIHIMSQKPKIRNTKIQFNKKSKVDIENNVYSTPFYVTPINGTTISSNEGEDLSLYAIRIGTKMYRNTSVKDLVFMNQFHVNRQFDGGYRIGVDQTFLANKLFASGDYRFYFETRISKLPNLDSVESSQKFSILMAVRSSNPYVKVLNPSVNVFTKDASVDLAITTKTRVEKVELIDYKNNGVTNRFKLLRNPANGNYTFFYQFDPLYNKSYLEAKLRIYFDDYQSVDKSIVIYTKNAQPSLKMEYSPKLDITKTSKSDFYLKNTLENTNLTEFDLMVSNAKVDRVEFTKFYIEKDAIDDNKLVMTIKKDATFYDGEIVRGSLYVQKSPWRKPAKVIISATLYKKRLPVIRTQVSTMVMNVGAVKEVVKTPISMDRNQLTFRSPTQVLLYQSSNQTYIPYDGTMKWSVSQNQLVLEKPALHGLEAKTYQFKLVGMIEEVPSAYKIMKVSVKAGEEYVAFSRSGKIDLLRRNSTKIKVQTKVYNTMQSILSVSVNTLSPEISMEVSKLEVADLGSGVLEIQAKEGERLNTTPILIPLEVVLENGVVIQAKTTITPLQSTPILATIPTGVISKTDQSSEAEWNLNKIIPIGYEIDHIEINSIPTGFSVMNYTPYTVIRLNDEGIRKGTYYISVSIYLKTAKIQFGYPEGKPIKKYLKISVVD